MFHKTIFHVCHYFVRWSLLNFFREIKVQNERQMYHVCQLISQKNEVFLENVALFQKQTDT